MMGFKGDIILTWLLALTTIVFLILAVKDQSTWPWGLGVAVGAIGTIFSIPIKR